MKVAWTIAALFLVPLGCATAVEDAGVSFDGGHGHGDTSTVVDDVGSANDTGNSVPTDGGRFDTSTTAHDDTGIAFDSGVDFDSGTAPDTTVAPFDTGITAPDTSPPPPTDGSTTCTKDTDCTFPFNCCQILAGACGVYVGPLYFPIK
jgi:hypothetical protein